MPHEKSKFELDHDLDEALKETFPGSDAIAVDATGDKPYRPIGRRPPQLDKDLIDELAREVKKRLEANRKVS
jgi:hypothetical protein